MSPSVPREIKGPRLAPLKISKDSHLIHKPCSTTGHHHPRHPVIIYTHSPRVIHTQASDFMALVQKLTGLSHSAEDEAPKAPQSDSNQLTLDDHNGSATQTLALEPQDHSSLLLDSGEYGDMHFGWSRQSSMPIAELPLDLLMPEIPTFASNSLDFFYAQTPFDPYMDGSTASF